MGNFGQIYDTADLPEQMEFSVIPAGPYTATITKAELKENKKGTGKLIDINWTISGPTHAGAVVFDTCNIQNESPKAQEIALAQLGSILRAIGLPRAQDSSELVGGVCSIKVSVKPAEGQYKERNEVKGYKAVDGSPVPMPAKPPMPKAPANAFARPTPTAPAPPTAADAPKTPHWLNK